MLDPDPEKKNADPQPWFNHYGIHIFLNQDIQKCKNEQKQCSLCCCFQLTFDIVCIDVVAAGHPRVVGERDAGVVEREDVLQHTTARLNLLNLDT